MKTDKQQKKWLKKNGYWKRVKELVPSHMRKVLNNSDPLSDLFVFAETDEGHGYWSKIVKRMEAELGVNSED